MSREALVTTKIELCYFFPLLPPMKTLFSSFYKMNIINIEIFNVEKKKDCMRGIL